MTNTNKTKVQSKERHSKINVNKRLHQNIKKDYNFNKSVWEENV